MVRWIYPLAWATGSRPPERFSELEWVVMPCCTSGAKVSVFSSKHHIGPLALAAVYKCIQGRYTSWLVTPSWIVLVPPLMPLLCVAIQDADGTAAPALPLGACLTLDALLGRVRSSQLPEECCLDTYAARAFGVSDQPGGPRLTGIRELHAGQTHWQLQASQSPYFAVLPRAGSTVTLSWPGATDLPGCAAVMSASCNLAGAAEASMESTLTAQATAPLHCTSVTSELQTQPGGQQRGRIPAETVRARRRIGCGLMRQFDAGKGGPRLRSRMARGKTPPGLPPLAHVALGTGCHPAPDFADDLWLDPLPALPGWQLLPSRADRPRLDLTSHCRTHSHHCHARWPETKSRGGTSQDGLLMEKRS